MAVDYRCVNKFTQGDAFPISDFSDIVQKIGHARYISTFDVKAGYWRTPVRADHQWLTAFICDEGKMGPNPIWYKVQWLNFCPCDSAGATFTETVCRLILRRMAVTFTQWSACTCAVRNTKVPETKTQIRQPNGFLAKGPFRGYSTRFCRPLIRHWMPHIDAVSK